MPELTPRRQRKIHSKRQIILKAAAAVFAQKGYRLATIHDVADAADMADGSIYNYFENKDALFQAIIEQLALSEQQPLLTVPGHLEELINQRMAHLKDQYDLVMAVFPEILGNPDLRSDYLEKFVTPVADQVEKDLKVLQSSSTNPVDSALSARLLVAAVLGFQVLMVIGDPIVQNAWSEPEVLAQVWSRFISMGLRSD